MREIRNVALISHGGAGKTTLVEAMLYAAGVTSRMGRVEEGNTVCDYDDEEKARGISISTAVAPLNWQDVKINLLDTPGYLDFLGEVIAALRVADSALVLVDAVSGVEVGTENVWERADQRKLPRMVFISRMDRENASFQGALDALKAAFQVPFAPLQLPIGEGPEFKGIVDLIEMKAYIDGEEAGIPEELKDRAEELRSSLVEAAAEVDEAILEKFVEEEEVTADELRAAIREGTKQGTIVPVLCGSATKGTAWPSPKARASSSPSRFRASAGGCGSSGPSTAACGHGRCSGWTAHPEARPSVPVSAAAVGAACSTSPTRPTWPSSSAASARSWRAGASNPKTWSRSSARRREAEGAFASPSRAAAAGPGWGCAGCTATPSRTWPPARWRGRNSWRCSHRFANSSPHTARRGANCC